MRSLMRSLSTHSLSGICGGLPRSRWRIIAIVPLLAVGCSAATSETSPEVDSVSEAILGNVVVNDCSQPIHSLFDTAMTIGKLVSQTPEFQNCIRANYRPCSGDDDKN